MTCRYELANYLPQKPSSTRNWMLTGPLLRRKLTKMTTMKDRVPVAMEAKMTTKLSRTEAVVLIE